MTVLLFADFMCLNIFYFSLLSGTYVTLAHVAAKQ